MLGAKPGQKLDLPKWAFELESVVGVDERNPANDDVTKEQMEFNGEEACAEDDEDESPSNKAALEFAATILRGLAMPITKASWSTLIDQLPYEFKRSGLQQIWS